MKTELKRFFPCKWYTPFGRIMKLISTAVRTPTKTYYYCPYWLEKTKGGYYLYKLGVSEESLPKELVDAVKKIRNG